MLKAKTSTRTSGSKDAALDSVVENNKRLNADIPAKLHQEVKMKAAQENTDMRGIIIKALEEYLAK